MTRTSWIDAAAWTSICGAASALAIASGVLLGGVVAETLVSVALTLLGASVVAFGLRLGRPSPRPVPRAVLGAVAWVLLLYACALSVARLPIPEGTREDAARLLLSPLLLVSRALFRVVDILGPQGRAEPASMYLPPWAGWVSHSCQRLFSSQPYLQEESLSPVWGRRGPSVAASNKRKARCTTSKQRRRTTRCSGRGTARIEPRR